MTLYLTIYQQGQAYEGPYTVFEKEVPWPFAPTKDDVIFVGCRENGERASMDGEEPVLRAEARGSHAMTDLPRRLSADHKKELRGILKVVDERLAAIVGGSEFTLESDIRTVAQMVRHLTEIVCDLVEEA